MGNPFALLAVLVLLLHLAFIAFVVAGGAGLRRWPGLVPWHLPSILWGAAVELCGWPCPLTPLEQWLLRQAGEGGYSGGFIDHYLLAVIYPSGLTRDAQLVLGLVVVALNLFWYVRFLYARRR